MSDQMMLLHFSSPFRSISFWVSNGQQSSSLFYEIPIGDLSEEGTKKLSNPLQSFKRVSIIKIDISYEIVA